MSDISEDEYADKLESHFIEKYGADNVRREHYIDIDRYVDFLVDNGIVTLAIEVENDEGDALHGAMQSVMYAAEEDHWCPVVVLPHIDTNKPEIKRMADQVAYVALPPEEL